MTPLPSFSVLEESPVVTPDVRAADLQLVVPVINEERRIGPTVQRLSEHLASRTWVSELIVVDNGSSDLTLEVVDRHHSDLLAVATIGCGRRGKGAAVRQGIRHTTADAVGYCDADLSTPPSAIDEAMALLAQGWDVVVGSRRCAGGEYVVPQPALRRVGGAVFHYLAKRVVGAVSDTQCGFKLFRGDVARKLFAASRLDGFAFDIEILARAYQAGHSVVEMPVAWKDREGSTFRPLSDGVRAMRDLAGVHRVLDQSEEV